jgi:YegS/Rv2252/BmrU family lipid kinase
VQDALRGHGLSVRRQDTRDIEHARELAIEAAGAGETVAALSGDGMVGAIAGALREEPQAVMAVLPGGRGNDLARVLGVPLDAVEACALLVYGVPRAIDLGVVAADGAYGGGHAFVGIASAGFDSDANRIANEAPSWLGGQVYTYAALRALAGWRPARFQVELLPTGERHEFSGYTIAVANSRAYGGGMMMAPHALLDDGLLEVIVVERVGKGRFLANLPKVFAGTHVELDSVHSFRAAEVLVSADRPFTMYADGDPIGELPLRLATQRGAVKVLVPRTGATLPFANQGSDPAGATQAGA